MFAVHHRQCGKCSAKPVTLDLIILNNLNLVTLDSIILNNFCLLPTYLCWDKAKIIQYNQIHPTLKSLIDETLDLFRSREDIFAKYGLQSKHSFK